MFAYELTRKIFTGYDRVCGEFCRTHDIAQTSFDILMFLANNPEYTTARDIVQVRMLKANLVSIHLDKLEAEGYITRTAVAGDRRKRALRLTEKAAPIVEAGRALQRDFFERLEENVDPESRAAFLRTLEIMNQNMDKLLEEQN